MKFDYKLKGVELTKAMQEKVETQLIKFEKLFTQKNNVLASIRVEKGKDKKIIEVTLKAKDFFARADVIDDDFYNGIDKVIGKLDSQLKKSRSHLKHSKKNIELFDKDSFNEIKEDEYVQIIKHKSIELIPMDIDEAICRMEALNHTFFIFLNSESNRVNVLYERKDKMYGLIELNY